MNLISASLLISIPLLTSAASWSTNAVLPSYKALGAPEMLANGNFKNGLTKWTVEEAGAKGKAVAVKEGPSGGHALRLRVTKLGDQSWQLQIYQGGLKISKGKRYLLEFWARSDQSGLITVNCMQNHEPWEHHGAAAEVPITAKWKKVSFPFTGPWDDGNARITITNLATKVGQTYWFAECSLKEVGK